MSKTATHLRSPVGGLAQTSALCGTARATFADDYLAVTCRRCKAASKTGKHRREVARAKLASLVAATPEAPFTPGSAVPYASPGVWKLEPGSVDVLAREGNSDRARPIPRFPSIAAAVQRWAAHVDEGASLRNSLAGLMKTEDGDRIRSTAPAGRVSNVERSVDDVLGVVKAIEGAYAIATTSAPHPVRCTVPPVKARTVRELMDAGWLERETKARAASTLGCSPNEVRRIGVERDALGTNRGTVFEGPAPEAIVHVHAALDGTFAGGMTWDGPPRVYLSPALCREIFTQRHAGRPAFSSKKRECVQRHDVETEDLRVMACLVSGHEVTTRHIALVMRRGNDEVRDMLERSGELAPQRRSA